MRSARLLQVLAASHVAIGLAIIVVGSRHMYGSDGIVRYHELATTPGLPYRDFPVEFAPLDTVLISIVGAPPVRIAYVLVVLANLIADLGLAWLLAQRWSRGTAIAYLAIMLPALTFAFQGTEIVWLLIAVEGAALVSADVSSQRLGGTLLGVAVLGRVWPLALAPVIARHGHRAFTAFIGCTLVGFAAWLLVAPMGASQVASFRGAEGWEVESTVGGLIWTIRDAQPVMDHGAPRVGVATSWEKALVGGLLAVGLGLVFRRTRTWTGDQFGAPALSGIALLLALAPIFSLEYVLWLVPWAAICWQEDRCRGYALLASIAVALTAALAVVYVTASAPGIAQALIVCRNVAVMAVPVLWLAQTTSVRGTSLARRRQVDSGGPPLDRG